ncbi:MAG: ribonuclease H-like domain-containing protein [Nanoarchaeota archaeon]|nr:ribonuclease H-like domain-containing protein [Nanoarchaeota archaeon]
MIRNSLVFLESLRARKEKSLWKQGIHDWQDFLQAKSVRGIAPEKKSYFDRRLHEAQTALLEENSAYFLGKLPAKEMWRLYDTFRDACGFLDIETDGYGRIVIVGLSDYFTTKTFVRGVNLEKELLEKELQRYKLLVTFNGAAFDLRKLKRQYSVELKVPHIDLKPLCSKLGWKGGLKEVEKMLNLRRPEHLYVHPVELWEQFLASGDKEVLERLIAYNAEDVENLKAVLERAAKELWNKIYKERFVPSSYARKSESHPLGSPGKSGL